MRVLLTGATGFVGRYIVRELLAKGYRVGCIARDPQKVKKLFGEEVKSYSADLSDKKALREVFEDFKPDYLIHLVGILTQDVKRGQTFMRVHYLYSKTLYQTAREYGGVKKALHMSSLGTHLKAPSMYHRTKYMAEEELKRSGINYTILRPSLILGPEQRLFYDLWNITRFIRLIALPGGGSYLFQPVDVRDVACAFVRSLELPESDGKTYELCGSKRVSFKELLEDIFGFWRRKVVFVPAPRILMYAGGLLLEKVLSNPPLSSDQILMMWKDNVCGLDEEVESEGVKKLCGREPIDYRESLLWSLEEFRLSTEHLTFKACQS